MNTPLVSIITVSYNNEETITDTIRSVTTQDYPNIEHVFIDGGSTDGTLDLIEAGRDSASLLISEPDDGIYDALNKGISAASGDVIGFLHSDDFYPTSTVIRNVISALDGSNIDAAYGDLIYVSEDEPTRPVRFWRSGDFTPRKLNYGWMPPHPTLFVKSQIYDNLGRFNTSYRISADYDFILRLFSQKSFKVAYIPEVLVHMRLGGASNGTVCQILTKSSEDLNALRANKVGGAVSLIMKNLRKVGQFAAARFSKVRF